MSLEQAQETDAQRHCANLRNGVWVYTTSRRILF